MPDISFLIDEKSSEMTPSHNRVAQYVLQNKNSIAFDTLDSMAAKIGVSTTTVIRFARLLGFDGFSAMQHSIQNGLQEHLKLPNRLNQSLGKIDREQLLLDSFKNDISNINTTLQSVSAEAVYQAVDLISTAKSVYILGSRASFALAHYMYTRLSQIQNNTALVQATGEMYAEEILKMTPDDVCLVYLFPRYTAVTITLLKALRKKKVPVILITDPENAFAEQYAGVVLHCQVNGASFKNSFAAPIVLTNYLSASVASKSYHQSMDTLTELEQILQDGQFMIL